MKKIGIFASGKGSLVETIVLATQSADTSIYNYDGSLIELQPIDADIVKVIYTDDTPEILDIIKKYNLSSNYVGYSNRLRKNAENQIIDCFKNQSLDFVVLPGFTKILSPELLTAFSNRILNLHLTYSEHMKGNNLWKKIHETYVRTLEEKGKESMVCGPSMFWITEKVDDGYPVAYHPSPFFRNTHYQQFFTDTFVAEINILNITLSGLCNNSISNWLNSESINEYRKKLEELRANNFPKLINLILNQDGFRIDIDNEVWYKFEHFYAEENILNTYKSLLVTPFMNLVFQNNLYNRNYYINGHEILTKIPYGGDD
jgi:folate-dependent phosphoribosylglycinamide formyltransferase PurN